MIDVNITQYLRDPKAADDRRAALVYVNDAFAEAILDGIGGECFAQAALFAGFQELVVAFGEEAVAKFAEELPQRIRHGEFSVGLKQ